MAQLLRTSAFKKIMPTDLTKTVGDAVAEAVTNRQSHPEAGKDIEGNGSVWADMPTPIIAAPPPEPASWPISPRTFMSDPAQKSFPAPVRIATRTSGSRST